MKEKRQTKTFSQPFSNILHNNERGGGFLDIRGKMKGEP